MRCRVWPRVSAYEDTPRKRAAFERGQRQRRQHLPLLAELVREGQHDADTEMAHRAAWWPELQQDGRDRRARDWRRARSRLAGFGDDLRAALRQLWRECPYPADPSYLLELLHAVERGRIDPARPPWKLHHALAPRVTPNPATFDEAFRQVGQRRVGGGPKTTATDEFTFIGNLGSGTVFLTSRVRLIEANESFYTSSGHRLRDSHVGRAGHWIDIQVRGPCSDADLALIERLASAVDSRRVVVRRA